MTKQSYFHRNMLKNNLTSHFTAYTHSADLQQFTHERKIGLSYTPLNLLHIN